MRRLAAIGALLLAGALLPPSAAATFGITSNASSGFTVTLNGTDLTGAWTVPSVVAQTDRAPAGNSGWNVTMTSTTFKTASGATLATTASSVVGVSASCAQAPCTAPTNSVGYPVALPAGTVAPAAAKVYNAAVNTGKGLFTVTPDLRTIVAADRDAGSYTSTVTLALVKGP